MYFAPMRTSRKPSGPVAIHVVGASVEVTLELRQALCGLWSTRRRAARFCDDQLVVLVPAADVLLVGDLNSGVEGVDLALDRCACAIFWADVTA